MKNLEYTNLVGDEKPPKQSGRYSNVRWPLQKPPARNMHGAQASKVTITIDYGDGKIQKLTPTIRLLRAIAKAGNDE